MTSELKTRQDELLRLFPRAGKDLCGVMKFCPRAYWLCCACGDEQ